MNDQVLHLVVPGLLGPMPRLDAAPLRGRFVHLTRWLARADHRVVPADTDGLLCELFDVVPPAGDLPSAALSYLADTGQPPPGIVYHAAPVHLRPDQDRLLLFDAPAGDLTPAQAAGFCAAFNDHFSADGWRLEAPVAGRWYLHLSSSVAIRTQPMSRVIGRNVDLFLPEGADAGLWRQRLNEMQMLFHGLAENAEREAAGQLPVNSLWLYGGGQLPTAGRTLSVVGQTFPLLEGLARLAAPSSGDSVRWLGDAQRAVWDANPAAWLVAVEQLETMLNTMPVGTWLYPGDGRGYRWTAASRWRWWRRPRPITDHMLADSMD